MSQHFPFLRFPFSNTTWLVKRVGDVASLISGVHLSPEEYDHVGSIPYFTGPSDITDSIDLVSKFTEKNSKLCKQGEVLITVKGSGVGKTAICKLPEAFMGRQLMSLRATPSLNVILKAIVDKNNKHLEALSMGNMIPGLSRDDILSLKISVPEHKDEQQKIADFLTAVDSKICQLTEKHRLLNEYKKGAMQQLFSQQLRFKDKDGNAFPEWETFRLCEIANPVKRKANKVIDNVMTISAGKGFLHQNERFSQVIAGTSLDKYTHIKNGEFAYNRGNSKSYTYGCIYKLEDAEALIPFVYRAFKLKKGVGDFYAQLFAMKYLDRQLRRLISSSARMDGLLNINEKDFYQISLPFPCIAEQQKIAQFLQSIDNKIAAVAEQIEQTKQFKKGLLQQMFV